MDTTDQYIEMCMKAVEIQDKRPRENAEPLFTPRNRVHIFNDGNFYYYDELHLLVRQHYWLPRQDQLQDMIMKTQIGNDTYCYTSLILDFVDFVNRPSELFTLEQQWLVFVMKEIYNKVWNDKDWVEL